MGNQSLHWECENFSTTRFTGEQLARNRSAPLWLNRNQAGFDDVPQGTSKHIDDTQATLTRTHARISTRAGRGCRWVEDP